MFILIVVTLLLITLVTKILKKESLPDISSFQDTFNYVQEKGRCDSLCENYKTDYDLSVATQFCQQKVSISIDGDSRTGEKFTGGLISGMPYCEDGIYCFHISNCADLTASNCLRVMKEFYVGRQGLPEETANQYIAGYISYGTCDPDPDAWGEQLPQGYVKARLPAADCQKYYGTNDCFVGADFWWRQAGYWEIYEEVQESGAQTGGIFSSLLLNCLKSGSSIQCSWVGCPASGDVSIFLNDGSFYKGTDRPVGSFTFGPMKAGSYTAILACGGRTATSGSIAI